MRKNLTILSMFLLLAALISAAGCKSSSKSSGTGIKKFTFLANDLAPDLTNKTYTVDSIAGTIKNADSISYTSILTKVVPSITFNVTPSEVRINDVAWNRTDPIDASKPFKLTVVAANKKDVKDYWVTINKHIVNPDSIIWSKIDHNISSTFDEAKVFYSNGEYVLIGRQSGGIAIYTSTDGSMWSDAASGLETDVDVMSGYTPQGTSLADSIYLLGDGMKSLYVYDAVEKNFNKLSTFEDVTVVDILGEYQGELLILALKDGNSVVLSFHDGVLTEKNSVLPNSFPKMGDFSPVLVKYDASTTFNVESMFVVGGVLEGGGLTDGVHATDNGWYWSNVAKIPALNFFVGVRHTSAVYYTKCLFAIGGITDEVDNMYITMQVSFDKGFTWTGGKTYQQLPENFKPKYGISAVTDDSGNLLVFGGYDEKGVYVPDFYKGRARQMDFKQK